MVAIFLLYVMYAYYKKMRALWRATKKFLRINAVNLEEANETELREVNAVEMIPSAPPESKTLTEKVTYLSYMPQLRMMRNGKPGT